MKLLTKKHNITCYCDFCGKPDDEAMQMIDGRYAFICDRCVEAATKLIRPNEASVVFGPVVDYSDPRLTGAAVVDWSSIKTIKIT